MSAQEARRTAFLNVLFDTRTGMFLGREGKWVSAAEFARDPPRSAEDLVPPHLDDEPPVHDPDPGPTYKCINGQLYVCSGLVCARVLQGGQPVRCP
jgi:hypothetical protein